MTQEASTGADTRPGAGDDRPITVASVPGSHVYVRHIAHEGKPSGVRRLEDPDPQAPERSTQQQWWPPVMLDPAWLADADYDLLHVHFGFDARDPAQLEVALDRVLDGLAHLIGELEDDHRVVGGVAPHVRRSSSVAAGVLDAPAARLIARGSSRLVPLDEVENQHLHSGFAKSWPSVRSTYLPG